MNEREILDLYDLMLVQLRDLHQSENMQLSFLDEMYSSAHSFLLEDIIDRHIRETHIQVERLNSIFELIQEKPDGEKAEGLKGIINDSLNLVRRCGNHEVCNAAIITAIQHINHHEIAGYGTAIAFARALERYDIGNLLLESLREEKKADLGLSDLAEGEINIDAKWTNLVEKVEQGSDAPSHS